MVSSTSATNNTVNNTLQNPAIKDNLGKDAFMKLLITQLQYQDPMKPMDDKEFIAQLAQFSSLEQMQEVNQNLTLLAQMNSVSQAADLIGKQITYMSGESLEKGRVTAVDFENGQPWLMIGETSVNPSNVVRVEP